MRGTRLGRRIFNRLRRGYKIISRSEKEEKVEKIKPEIVQIIERLKEPVVEKEKEEIVEETEKKEGLEIPEFMFEKKVKVGGLYGTKEEEKKLSLVYPLIPSNPAKGEPIFAYVKIFWDDKSNRYVYQVIEPPLSDKLKDTIRKIRNLIEQRLDVDFSKLKRFEAEEYLHKQVEELLSYYNIKLSDTENKILHYYIIRDFIGLGKIEPIMNDEQIEDISCDGVGVPLFVFHRNPKLGSLVTNVTFDSPEELDSFVMRLAQMTGKSISILNPLLSGILPDGSRVQATLATDIARKGSNFTIRKFISKPLTPIHLLNYNTLDLKMLAYLWMAVDFGKSILVSGGTASGKTSLLNILSLFIRPEKKIVSIEDSVTGDCEILIEKDGKIRKIPIGKLVDFYIEKYGGKWLDRESCRINPDGIRVFSVNKEGKVVLSPIRSFIRHKVNKDVVVIKTRTGKKIKVTGDHSLFTLSKNGDIVPVEARKLNVGSFIATPRYIPFSGSHISKINLLHFLDKLEDVFVEGEFIRSIPQKLIENIGYKKQNIRWWKKNSSIPTEVLKKLIDNGLAIPQDSENIYLKPSKKGHKIPIKIYLNDDLLTLIGLWLADGSYDKNSIIISNPEEECRDVIRRVADKLNIKAKMHSDGVSLMLNSSVLKKVFINVLKLNGNAYTKRVPNWIFNLSNEQIAKVLKGYFSGDGLISDYEIEANSSSLGLQKDIELLLLRFGIISRIGKFYEKDKTRKMRISGIDMIRKFYENIGVLQTYKNEKLKIIINRTSNHDTSDVIPLSQEFLRNLEKEVGSFATNSYYYLGSKIGRRYLSQVSKSEGILSEKASMLANSDIFWDQIDEIDFIDAEETFVYDLSVPDYENFICENILVHNTAELKLPHPHWIPHVARVPISAGKMPGEIDLFDLLKESLRQRPDYIIVGEVRGPEAFVLFQEMATGHPSLSTIHAENIPRLIDRLTTPPISLPPSLIEALDAIVFMTATRFRDLQVRRVTEIVEITGFDRKTNMPKFNQVFRWDPMSDKFLTVNKSFLLESIAEEKGIKKEHIIEELERRMLVLNWLKEQNISEYQDIYNVLNIYYTDPERVISVIKGEI
jgi:type IV secretory pathway ATPase VirB11/archaellum biosynthesis ATPase/intein/homing endonuclease